MVGQVEVVLIARPENLQRKVYNDERAGMWAWTAKARSGQSTTMLSGLARDESEAQRKAESAVPELVNGAIGLH